MFPIKGVLRLNFNNRHTSSVEQIKMVLVRKGFNLRVLISDFTSVGNIVIKKGYANFKDYFYMMVPLILECVLYCIPPGLSEMCVLLQLT